MTASYNPKDLIVTVGGVPLSGFAPDESITIERNEANVSLRTGASGEGVRSINPNRSGTISITLMASSASNDTLNALARADELAGRGQAPLLIKDGGGRTLVAATSVWVQTEPPIGYGSEPRDREWVLEAEALDMTQGGMPS